MAIATPHGGMRELPTGGPGVHRVVARVRRRERLDLAERQSTKARIRSRPGAAQKQQKKLGQETGVRSTASVPVRPQESTGVAVTSMHFAQPG